MPAESPSRPGQATLAGWLIIGGSIILVAAAWQRISSLHTMEVQEELQSILSEPPVDGTGLSLSTLSTIVRVLCMVAAGAATAATILGFQALRRSTSARIALTCLAPLVLVGGFATAGFFAPMVVAGIALLWLQPTRDWFAGKAWTPQAPPARQSPGQQPPAQPPVQPPGWQDQPPAQPPGRQEGATPPGQGAPLPNPYLAHRPPVVRRPPALIWACVLTWVFTAVVAGGMVLVSVALAISGDDLFAEFERQQGPIEDFGVSSDQVRVAIYAMTAVAVPWCMAAAALALGAILGRRRARIALAVSSAVAGLVCLALAIASPALVVLVAACAVTTWLLLRADSASWRR